MDLERSTDLNHEKQSASAGPRPAEERSDMRQVVVQYRVKPDRAAENERLVRAVYDELHRTNPSGLRYATFQLEDGVSFVHVAEVDDETENPLTRVEAFRAFQAEIQDRCEQPPAASRAREIGSFRMFDR
jgi:hypothetical protein